MKLYADVVLIKLQFLVLSGIIVTTALGYDTISSGLFTMTFFLTLGIWVVEAQKRITRANMLALMIAMTACMCVLLNALVTNTILSFGYLKKLIMFCSTVFFVGAMREYTPEKDVVDFVFKVNTLLALFFVAGYFAWGEMAYLYYGRLSAYLMFGFSNPNLTAVFLSSISIIELICASVQKKITRKIFHVVLAGVLCFFVVLTQSRNAMLMLVLFLTAYLVVLLFPQNRLRMTKWMAGLIAVFPMLFAGVYMLVVYTPWFQRLFAFIAGEGKALSSRVTMWTIGFEAIAASPVIGAYSQISGGDGSSQMHNSHLDVAASYGMPVLIMLCVFLYQVIFDKYEKQKLRIQLVCLFGFVVLLMSGIGEAMIFSGGQGIYIFMGLVRMLVNYDWKKMDTENRV